MPHLNVFAHAVHSKTVPHYETLILCKPSLADTAQNNETQMESTTSIYRDFFLQVGPIIIFSERMLFHSSRVCRQKGHVLRLRSSINIYAVLSVIQLDVTLDTAQQHLQ